MLNCRGWNKQFGRNLPKFSKVGVHGKVDSALNMGGWELSDQVGINHNLPNDVSISLHEV